jgi:hypothetical protein
MENNIIVSGVPERNQGKQTTENLPDIIRKIFVSEMEMDESVTDNLGVMKVFWLREFDSRRNFPRPICVQLTNKGHVMRNIKMLI